MPKDIMVDPERVRHPGYLRIEPIPLHRSRPTVADAVEELGADTLVQMLRDMVLIREFEKMLDGFKREHRFGPIEYAHKGPAHLSIGQEAAAVGQARALRAEDHIFGSHRSHGEFLAKGLAAIAQLGPAELEGAFKSFGNTELADAVDAALPFSDPRLRATSLLLYGLAAEIFARRTGFNRGLAGSMHAFFTPFGIYPNNAIVGGSAPIAVGAALYRFVQQQAGVVVANIGDGALGCGPVLEAVNFAGMAQIARFLPGGASGLPVLFFIVNNFYAMGGQTIGETMSFDRAARLAAGFKDTNLHAATIDGTDPLAVYAAVRDSRRLLRDGRGPVLLDCETYRFSGHSSSDASSYRTREEVAAWEEADPIATYATVLAEAGIASPGLHTEFRDWADDLLVRVAAVAVDEKRSPRLPLAAHPGVMERMMLAGTEIDLAAAPRGAVDGDLDSNPRVRQIRRRSRSGLENGARLSPMRAVQYRDALFEAIAAHAVADSRLLVYGEENRDWGGAFGVYRGLTELLPVRRLFNTPISEAAIVGSAVGVALEGGRALVELMYADFIGRAGDEIFNQLAKWRAMSGGLVDIPVVVRVSVGSKYGAQHSQDWSGLIAAIPGLKVAYPATPHDAKGLMAGALAGNDPVMFFESQDLYDQTEILTPGGVPAGYYRTPFGQSRVVRPGRDVTVVTIGPPLYRAIQAADALAEEDIDVEVVDARTLVPFDHNGVTASARRTRRLLVVTDACAQGSFAKTIAADVGGALFGRLAAPAAALGSRDWIVPPAELVDAFIPTSDRIAAAVRDLVGFPSAGLR
jgi:2-oxoisovalerate dehydrogenase E1 component